MSTFASESEIGDAEKALVMRGTTTSHDVVGGSTSNGGFQSDKEVGGQNPNGDRWGRGEGRKGAPNRDAFIVGTKEGG